MERETLLLSAQVPCQLRGRGMVVYESLITQHFCPKEGHFCSMPHTAEIPWGHAEKDASLKRLLSPTSLPCLLAQLIPQRVQPV